MPVLEICCGDIESVNAAVAGGADRIELCTSLETGGLTPSPGLTERALWKMNLMQNQVPVNILIRPRAGDFFYSDRELAVCCQDAAMATSAGAAGIVFGSLTPGGNIDEEACRRVIDAIDQSCEAGCRPSLTFHRAFDYCLDPFIALRTIIDLGFDRILTSGQSKTAFDGAELIKLLRIKADGRIIIMPGGNVTPDNIAGIMQRTGATEIHASAKKMRASSMTFHRQGIMLAAEEIDYMRFPVTDKNIVAELKRNMLQ